MHWGGPGTFQNDKPIVKMPSTRGNLDLSLKFDKSRIMTENRYLSKKKYKTSFKKLLCYMWELCCPICLQTVRSKWIVGIILFATTCSIQEICGGHLQFIAVFSHLWILPFNRNIQTKWIREFHSQRDKF